MNIRIWFVSKIFRFSTAKSLLWTCVSSFNVAEDRKWCWLMIVEIDCFESKIIVFIKFAFKFIAELFRFFIRCVYSRIIVFKSYLSRHRDVLAHVISNWHFSRFEIIASNSKWNVARKKKDFQFFSDFESSKKTITIIEMTKFSRVSFYSFLIIVRAHLTHRRREFFYSKIHNIFHFLFAREYCERNFFAVFKINFFTSWLRRCSRRCTNRINDRDFDIFIKWIDFEKACFFVAFFLREVCDSRTFNSKNTKIFIYSIFRSEFSQNRIATSKSWLFCIRSHVAVTFDK